MLNQFTIVMKKFLIILLFILFSCAQEEAPKFLSQIDSAQIENNSSKLPPLSESELRELFNLQLRVNKNPADIERRKELLSKSYFPGSSIIITFGCARQTHPKTGQKISTALLKRAARIDANRWAAYSNEWLKNNYMPDFGKLNSTFTCNDQQISSFTYGDSLVIAYAYKIN